MVTRSMTTEEAIRYMRSDDLYAEVVRGSYLDEDREAAADRFWCSAEFGETLRLLPALNNLRVVDLGAGTGVASRALARSGAFVIAIEPDLSDVVGLGALAQAVGENGISSTAAFGGHLPIRSDSVDIVYCRQVLHHIPNLTATLADCARVLRPGGLFVATREHVVDNDGQLQAFLAQHQVHQLAGGENAWTLDDYRGAIESAGLQVRDELGPWDSVVNAFPAVTSRIELQRAPEMVLRSRFGPTLGRLGRVPGIRGLIWKHLRRPKPGRLYSFVAEKAVDQASARR